MRLERLEVKRGDVVLVVVIGQIDTEKSEQIDLALLVVFGLAR